VPTSEEIPLTALASNLEVLTESQKSLTKSTNLAKGSHNILEKAEIDSESEPAEDIEEKTSPQMPKKRPPPCFSYELLDKGSKYDKSVNKCKRLTKNFIKTLHSFIATNKSLRTIQKSPYLLHSSYHSITSPVSPPSRWKNYSHQLKLIKTDKRSNLKPSTVESLILDSNIQLIHHIIQEYMSDI